MIDFNISDLDLDKLTESDKAKLLGLIENYNKLDDKADTSLFSISFIDFCEKYLDHYFYDAFPTYCSETIELLNSEDKGKRIAVAIPRSHGKSTIFSFAYAIYATATQKHNYIVIFGATATGARSTLNNIRLEVENNTKLLNDFGSILMPEMDNRGSVAGWNDNDLIFRGGQKISAKGVGSTVRGLNHYGKRPSLLILDDIEDEKNTRTIYQRERHEFYIKTAVLNLGGDKGIDIFMIGTIQHSDSYLAKAVSATSGQAYNFWTKLYKRAVLDWNTGEVLWPEHLSFDALLDILKEIGEKEFNQEYQQIPGRLHASLFKRENFTFFSGSVVKENTFKLNKWHKYLYVDPSMGKPKSDFSSLTVIGVDGQYKQHILEWITKRFAPEALGEAIKELNNIFHFHKIGFEINATQGVFINLFKQMGVTDPELANLPWEGVNHRLPKKNRIDALEPYINRGDILFRDDCWELDSYALGMLQLENYTGMDNGDNDDGPDSLAGCFELVSRYWGKNRNFVTQYK